MQVETWSAWYNPDIPITVGPYKFHGLPGLVMMLKDRKMFFSFIVNEVKKGDFPIDSKTENFFCKRRIENLNISTKMNFTKPEKNLVKCLLVIKLDL
jgi:GLPGLI family protein